MVRKKLIPWIAAAVIAIVIFLFQTGLMALILWITDVNGNSAAIAMTAADIIFMITGLAVTLTVQLAFVMFSAGVAAKHFGFSYIHLLLTLPVIYALFTAFHVRLFFLFVFTPGDFITNLFVAATMGVVMLIAINNTKWRIKRKTVQKEGEE